MAVVIAGVHFEAMGTTRSEVFEALDRLADEIVEAIGGTPWVTVIDSINKIEAPASVKDDQGMCYVGTRRVTFSGPMVREYQGATFHAGFDTQRFAREEQLGTGD